MRIAVIGLGPYGAAFAANLLKNGHQVSAFDGDPARAADLLGSGLRFATNPGEAADQAELAIIALPTWEAVVDAVEGPRGMLVPAPQRLAIVDTGPAAPWDTQAMAERLAKRGVEWLDAPTSGTAAQARTRDIVFMAGGTKAGFERVKPVLEGLGKKAIHAGKHGDASMLKLIVNITVHLNQAAAIEGFVMALKAGLDPDVVFDAMSSGTAASTIIATRGRDMLKGRFEDKKGELTLKSYDHAIEAAQRLGVMLPMTVLFREFARQALYSGWGHCDNMVIMRVYEQLAGIKR